MRVCVCVCSTFDNVKRERLHAIQFTWQHQTSGISCIPFVSCFWPKITNARAGERRSEKRKKWKTHMCAPEWGCRFRVLSIRGYIGCICVYWMLIWMCVYMSSFVCINIVWYDWTKNRLLLHIRFWLEYTFLKCFCNEILDFFPLLSFGFFFRFFEWFYNINGSWFLSLSIYFSSLSNKAAFEFIHLQIWVHFGLDMIFFFEFYEKPSIHLIISLFHGTLNHFRRHNIMLIESAVVQVSKARSTYAMDHRELDKR